MLNKNGIHYKNSYGLNNKKRKKEKKSRTLTHKPTQYVRGTHL